MIVGSSMSAEPVGYGAPLAMIEAMSHGQPRPSRMLKTFEPSTLHTAMLPCPLRATRMEESASGTEVPAARMVRPMRNSGIWRMQPARAAKSTMRKERRPIHMMDMVKVPKYQASHASSRQSGMEIFMAKASGHEMKSRTLPRQVLSSSTSSSSGAGSLAGVFSSSERVVASERVREGDLGAPLVSDILRLIFLAAALCAFASSDLVCPCFSWRFLAVLL
mmetsp:Transcript_43931/g.93496  ORF Transcript_43931/g.93496 Transcript_43931/m.93496 type:complete len:220 (-) Transcript_43931:994-1653(-)